MSSTTPARLPRRDATANPPAALIPLFKKLASEGGKVELEQIKGELSRLRITPQDLGDAIHVDAGAYVRTLVFENEFVEVLVMAWLPGQRSPIHDHKGSGCAVKVVAGRAVERYYRPGPEGLVVKTGERSHSPGEVTASFDADIHSLGNAVEGPAGAQSTLVTLHVYSPPLAPTKKYVERT